MATVIRLDDVRHEYRTGDTVTVALDGVSMSIEAGEFCAIIGPSGSGKSTLMNLIGCLDRPTSGSIRIGGHLVSELDDDQLTGLRSQAIGFVFQQFQLLPRTNAVENVAAPLLYQGMNRRAARGKAADLLTELGLGDRLNHDRTQLSGGQQQRVAIARAIVTGPALILADEPTGALDTRSSEMIMDLLTALNQAGQTVVVITHDADVAVRAGRRVHIRDGKIESEERQTSQELVPA